MWWVTLRAGQTYRIALQRRPAARASRFSGRPGELESDRRASGYTTFTPGPDGGGRYVLEVMRTTADATKTVAYRLTVAAAEPGRRRGRARAAQTWRRSTAALAAGTASTSSTSTTSTSPIASDVRLRLGRRGGLPRSTLLTDTGARIASPPTDQIRRRLERGRYVVAVRGARSADEAATYTPLARRPRADEDDADAHRRPRSRRRVRRRSHDRDDPTPDAGWIGAADRPLRPAHRLAVPPHVPRARPRRHGHVDAARRPDAGGRVRRISGTLRFSPSRSGYMILLVATPLPGRGPTY